jgi:hypothetical protein
MAPPETLYNHKPTAHQPARTYNHDDLHTYPNKEIKPPDSNGPKIRETPLYRSRV